MEKFVCDDIHDDHALRSCGDRGISHFGNDIPEGARGLKDVLLAKVDAAQVSKDLINEPIILKQEDRRDERLLVGQFDERHLGVDPINVRVRLCVSGRAVEEECSSGNEKEVHSDEHSGSNEGEKGNSGDRHEKLHRVDEKGIFLFDFTIFSLKRK